MVEFLYAAHPSLDAPKHRNSRISMLLNSGGARGRLGAIAPRRSMLAPQSEGEKRFFWRFLAFIVP